MRTLSLTDEVEVAAIHFIARALYHEHYGLATPSGHKPAKLQVTISVTTGVEPAPKGYISRGFAPL